MQICRTFRISSQDAANLFTCIYVSMLVPTCLGSRLLGGVLTNCHFVDHFIRFADQEVDYPGTFGNFG